MTAAGTRVGLAALTVLAALLACGLAAELAWPGSDAPDQATLTGIRTAPRLPRIDPARVAAGAVDHTDAWVATILARPLFTRDRRPSAGGTTVAADDRLPRLTGIAVSPSGRSAIFAGSSGGKPIVLSEGGTLGLYTVKSIHPDTVQVAGPGGLRTLAPTFDQAPPPAAANPQPGFPGQGPVTPGNPFGLRGRLPIPVPGRPPFSNGAFRMPGQFAPAATDSQASE